MTPPTASCARATNACEIEDDPPATTARVDRLKGDSTRTTSGGDRTAMRRTFVLLTASLLIAGCGTPPPTASLGVLTSPSQSGEPAPPSPPSPGVPVSTGESSPTPVQTEAATAPASRSPDAPTFAPTPATTPAPKPTTVTRPTPTPSPSRPPNSCLVTNVSSHAVFDDLNAAIRSADRGSTLTVQGTCTRVGPRGHNAVFVIDRSLTLKGVRTTDSGDPTLDGSSLAGVVWVNHNLTVTIVGLTIANGDAENSNGGGLFNEGSVVTLRDTIVTNNRAWVSGGIDNSFGGVMTLLHSTVSDNRSHAGGGGIYNSGTMTLTDSTVSGNASETSGGGGIINFANKSYPNSGTMTVVDSTISGNSAAQSGGGIINSGSEAGVAYLSISGSTIADNRSGGRGGGISSEGQLEFAGPTTIGGNAAARGGGVWVSAGLAVGSCPRSMGGMVTYEPRNSPTDYDGVACVDQESMEASQSLELSAAGGYAAQTFTTRTTGALTSVTLHLEHTGLYTQTAIVQLESVAGGLPTGEVLAVATPRTVPSAQWLTFGFPSPASLVKGTEYAIVLVAPTPPWQYSDLDPYPSGHAVVNGVLQATEDFAFMTWVAP